MTDLRGYAVVTAAYWGFTLTDGALRMLVLLHFHLLGFSPLDLASLFLLYEAMGIVTNLAGGWIAARFGLRLTLLMGLAIQVFGLLLLSALDTGWSIGFSVFYVMVAQALSGVAKDLTKMSSKSAVKLVVKEDSGEILNTKPGLLFRWVALLTGSKNALKGLGFLLGGLLLEGFGFQLSLWVLAFGLVLVLLGSFSLAERELGRVKSSVGVRDLFSKTREINLLSFSRVFLFAARDVWFVVALPVFLYSAFGWSFEEVGAFMAVWVIGYGLVQAVVPRFTRGVVTPELGVKAAGFWGGTLATVPLLIAMGIWMDTAASPYILIIGLLVFGFVFAVNSSLHSYLIVGFSDADKVALNVGFYYMANAVGRLGGTLLSGVVFQLAGLTACLVVSAAMVLIATVPLFLLSQYGEKSAEDS